MRYPNTPVKHMDSMNELSECREYSKKNGWFSHKKKTHGKGHKKKYL